MNTRHLMVGWLGACCLAGSCLAASADGRPTRELAVCADPANLPASNDREQGFENRIAQLLADELHASLRYTWNSQRRSFLRRTLQSGACDLVIGVPPGLPGVLAGEPYYRASYVLISRRGEPVPRDFDDPLLRQLRIGLQALGAEGANTPPAAALARRGLGAQVVGFPMWSTEDDDAPMARLVDAVAQGQVDVAMVWGPLAGHFAKAHGERLQVSTLAGDPLQPELAFSYPMSLGVRRQDASLLAELQAAMARRHAELQAILADHGVVPEQAPALQLAHSEGK